MSCSSWRFLTPRRGTAWSFNRKTTEGFVNKYVQDQMFGYDATTVKTFWAQAVNVVQIERRRIRIGNSDTQTMDGLVPVMSPI